MYTIDRPTYKDGYLLNQKHRVRIWGVIKYSIRSDACYLNGLRPGRDSTVSFEQGQRVHQSLGFLLGAPKAADMTPSWNFTHVE